MVLISTIATTKGREKRIYICFSKRITTSITTTSSSGTVLAKKRNCNQFHKYISSLSFHHHHVHDSPHLCSRHYTSPSNVLRAAVQKFKQMRHQPNLDKFAAKKLDSTSFRSSVETPFRVRRRENPIQNRGNISFPSDRATRSSTIDFNAEKGLVAEVKEIYRSSGSLSLPDISPSNEIIRTSFTSYSGTGISVRQELLRSSFQKSFVGRMIPLLPNPIEQRILPFNPNQSDKIDPTLHSSSHSSINTPYLPFKVNTTTTTTYSSSPTMPFLSPPELLPELAPVLSHKGPMFATELTSNSFFHNLTQPDELHMHKFPIFTTCSRDDRLLHLAASNNLSFVSSTSSTTRLLRHIYYTFLGQAPIDSDRFSSEIKYELKPFFTASAKAHATVLLRKRRVKIENGRCSTLENNLTVDDIMAGKTASSEFASRIKDNTVQTIWGLDSEPQGGSRSHQILVDMGNTMEKMFVMRPEQFRKRLHKTQTDETQDGGAFHSIESVDGESLSPDFDEDIDDNDDTGFTNDSYLFCQYDGMLIRSQLDCHSPKLLPSNLRNKPSPSLPSSPYSTSTTFDLKSRAVYPIRYNVANYKEYTNYTIKKHQGLTHSFEREYFDMGRTSFLPYLLQCRLGNMRGVFVAYHNTAQIFGYEFISVEDMEKTVIGKHSYYLGNRIFNVSLKLLNEALNTITNLLDDKHDCVRVTMDQGRGIDSLNIWVETLPSINDEFDNERPFHLRWYSLYRLDTLATDELRKLCQQLSLSIESHPSTSLRIVLVQRLESYMAQNAHYPLPPLSHLYKLSAQGHIRKFVLKIQHTLPNECIMMNNSWKKLENESEIRSIKSEYALVEEKNPSDVGRRAREYYEVLKEQKSLSLTGKIYSDKVPVEIDKPGSAGWKRESYFSARRKEEEAEAAAELTARLTFNHKEDVMQRCIQGGN